MVWGSGPGDGGGVRLGRAAGSRVEGCSFRVPGFGFKASGFGSGA